MGKTLFDLVSNEGKNVLFGQPFTEELTGRTAVLPDGTEICFGKELATKCDDDLFLADAAGKLLLVKEQPDESLKAFEIAQETADAAALPEALEGWETDLSFASGYVLTAKFQDGAVTLRPSPEPVIGDSLASGGLAAPQAAQALPPLAALPLRAVEADEKRFLFFFPESGEAVVFNARRFLLYAILRSRIVAGFVEVPPKDQP